MATLAVAPLSPPPPTTSQGIGRGSSGGGGTVPSTSTTKHYSTRQRNVETTVQTVKTDTGKSANGSEKDPESKQETSENANTAAKNNTTPTTQTSPTTNMPTKRFSFLMRSSSMNTSTKHDPTTNSTTTNPQKEDPVTPSDQAILDKLAQLTLPDPEVIVKPRVKCTLFNPACVRCSDPVYPQERIEPTLRLVYHNSCFKCYHCGLRLTLKTFCRSPLTTKDFRVYCRSHVPVLDPGRVAAPAGGDERTSHTLPRDNSNNRPSSTAAALLRDQLDIVKCDTIGLRYL